MWHALRAELAYSRPYLFGGLGLAAGVALIVSVVFFAVGGNGPPSHAAAGIRTMFLIMAPLIVSFVIQAYRSEERRTRLLMAGPLTPLQLAGIAVVLPTIMFGIGVVAAGLAFVASAVITGKVEIGALNMVGFVGAQIFSYVQMGLLAQEATAAYSQRRVRTAAAGWAAFGLAVLLLTVFYLAAASGFLESLTWIVLILGHLVVALLVVVPTVALYAGRTDFTS